jgi:hypothetical protein
LDRNLFCLPENTKYGIFTNAIEKQHMEDQDAPYLLFQKFSRIEMKCYAPDIGKI